MATEKSTLAYALPPGIPRLRIWLEWLSRHRRALIVIAILLASIQVSRMVPIAHHTELQMCRYCGARRTLDRRTCAGIAYHSSATPPAPYSSPPAKFLDPAHAHDWRGGEWFERRGNVWGLGPDTIGGNFGRDHHLTENGLALMAVFAGAPVEVQRDIYADIARCRNSAELEQVMNHARVKYRRGK